ncbi:unnamed protein product [Ixodes persulcatus]
MNCFRRIKNTYYRLPSQQCFTIDVNAMHKDDPLFKECPQQAKWELELRYRWSKESTMLLLPVGSYPIFVHQTGHCPPDKLPAVVLLPGKVIQVTVKQLRTIRLPSPYKSMCTDYKSMGSFPEFKGFLNHDANVCYNALMKNGSYSECKRSCTLPCEQTFKLKLKYRSDVEDLVIYHPTLTVE